MQKLADAVVYVTATSRKPRPGEADGVRYYFYSPEKFRQEIEAGNFFEWSIVHGEFKGVRRDILGDTLRKKHCGGLRVGLSGQFKQEFSPWVAYRVENRAKSGNHFSKSGNGFASFEQARHGRTDVGRSISFPEKCFNPFCLSSMLDPLECR